MRKAIPVALLALVACSAEPSEEERQAAVAEVEANQTPEPEELVLERIGYPDIEQNDLYGAGCNFAPDGGGMGAVAIAMAEEGYLKRKGEILTSRSRLGKQGIALSRPLEVRREGLFLLARHRRGQRSADRDGNERLLRETDGRRPVWRRGLSGIRHRPVRRLT